MKIVKEYETINSVLRMVGKNPITIPLEGNDCEKIEFLLLIVIKSLILYRNYLLTCGSI